MGALELHRFHQATTGLARVLAATREAPTSLGDWLAPLPAGLRNAVRLRVDGERIALPGPGLTPYLVGLLVLLGMLGTFLGMVATLKGTGLALESATDLEAIRSSLAAPVKGLGLAFGTSVAGVAASAMLGLMSALARRERLRAAQQLDACIATTLRGFSPAHQREESLRLLKAQAEMAPALVVQLQALVAQVERQGQALQDRLVANQAQFHGEAQRAYTGLAESVDRSLKTSLADGARLAGAAIEPAVQATLAGLARESATLRDTLAAAVQQQLDGVTARLEGTHTAAMQRLDDVLTRHTHEALSATVAGFEQHAATLLRGVEHTVQAITGQAEAHARATLDEIARLVQTASEAPAPRRRSSARCARRSATAWCATTRRSTSGCACWARWTACSTRSRMPAPSSAPRSTPWCRPPPRCWTASEIASARPSSPSRRRCRPWPCR
jgi:hypothetical protein